MQIHVCEDEGDILVFLTGQEEIEAAQQIIEEYAKTLAPNVPRLVPVPLFGQMSIEAQQIGCLYQDICLYSPYGILFPENDVHSPGDFIRMGSFVAGVDSGTVSKS